MKNYHLLIISTIAFGLLSCSKDNEQEDGSCICTTIYDPVCVEADNGEIKEYPNLCEAECDGYKMADIINCNEGYNDTFAEVVSVSVSGNSGAYNFSVGVLSPDDGCGKYANWWEVVTESGELLYRRILAHSHTPPQFAQPFVRSGGPVDISDGQTVIVRAHMNTSGYGSRVFKGSVSGGFTAMEIEKNFALDIETENPQPGECPF